MSLLPEAIAQLRMIVAAWTAADLEDVERLVTEAGVWLAESVDGQKKEDPDVNEDAAGEPAPTGEKEPAPAEPTPTGISPVHPIGHADAALVGLYNAAKRLIDQGPSSSTMLELEAAVRNAERFVR